MTEMVKNGEITREQMEQRLNRMKKSMDQERTITKKEYDEAVARMKTMVEAGEITREQMQQRLAQQQQLLQEGLKQEMQRHGAEEKASREAAAVAELEHSREEATALEAELAAERTWTLLELDRQHEAHTALAEALAEAQVALHRSEEEQEARQVRLARTCI